MAVKVYPEVNETSAQPASLPAMAGSSGLESHRGGPQPILAITQVKGGPFR